MTLPRDLDGALLMLGDLVHDGNLWLGLQTVGLILLVAGIATWALLRVAK